MKQITFTLASLIILLGVFFGLNRYIYNQKQADLVLDYMDAEYIIDNQVITLHDGVAETETAPEAQSKTITQYIGNELVTDLNDDGYEDVIFLLTQETGGSGTFYYVVAALNSETGYVGSSAYFLGDRIVPQTIEEHPNLKGVAIVKYLDRNSAEPMTTVPSVNTSVWLKLDTETLQFGVVEQDFEGESDPTQMSLTMKDWVWESVLYNDGLLIEPQQAGSFAITFTDMGTFSATTDCNHMGGNYMVNQHELSFDQITTTLMFCEGSQENEFLKVLENTQSFHFTTKGELIFNLKFDSGTAVFK